MSRVKSNLRPQIAALELEWRSAFESAVRARSAYHGLAADPTIDLDRVDQAREMYERSEAIKNRLLDQIDRSSLVWHVAEHLGDLAPANRGDS